jgi:K+-transporting ATPase ATPase C chain
MRRLLAYTKNGVQLFLLLTVLLGGVVPLVFTAISQVIFHSSANGSLVVKDNKTIGSELIGQDFYSNKYFWGRLSATTPAYNAAASASSNLSFANVKIIEQANNRLGELKGQGKTPLALITASASGLDPHLPVMAVRHQIPRVAKARRISVEKLEELLSSHIESPHLGFIGVERVNILRLNLALDAL